MSTNNLSIKPKMFVSSFSRITFFAFRFVCLFVCLFFFLVFVLLRNNLNIAESGRKAILKIISNMKNSYSVYVLVKCLKFLCFHLVNTKLIHLAIQLHLCVFYSCIIDKKVDKHCALLSLSLFLFEFKL